MEYYSTSGNARRASLREAVVRGIAPDRGLYMPATIRCLPPAFFNNIADMSLQEIAYVVANTLMGEDIPAEALKTIVAESLSFDIPLVKVPGREDIFSLELFHGPSMSFKDVGARFMARLVAHYVERDSPLNVLVATSGDTGGAVAAGFYNVPGVNVYVLYPRDKMSRPRLQQLFSWGRNIHTIAVNGDYDECQEMVKQVFVDTDEVYRQCNLVTANSLNVGRLLPQTIYYFHAYARLMAATSGRAGDVVVAVPCGNLGNLTAAVIAKRMGLPIKRLVAATNSNDSFVEYLRTGEMKRPRHPKRTLASAADVAYPTNFARLLDLYKGSRQAMCADIEGFSIDDIDIAKTMKDILATEKRLVDPHSAMARKALELSLKPGETGIMIEAAHPAKFPTEVHAVTGLDVELPASAIGPATVPVNNSDRIAPNPDALKKYLLRKLRPARKSK